MPRLTIVYNPLTSFYNGLRSTVFPYIYPAKTFFDVGTMNFIGIQRFLALPYFAEFCHPLKFDFYGHMYRTKLDDTIEPGMFEAMLISELNQHNIYKPDMRYIIFVGGNTTCFQVFISEMIELHRRHERKVQVIGFNPPGIGKSPGLTTSPDEYCAALKSIIDNLCNNGIPPANIMVLGHSLGGGIAVHVVAQYHYAGKDIKLFADRTMKSIGDAVGAKLIRGIPTLLRSSVGLLIYVFFKLLIRFLKLDLNVAEDFCKINNINPGSARGMSAEGDEMLRDCDLYSSLPKDMLKYYPQFKLADNDSLRRPHSKNRRALFAKEGHGNAEEHLDGFIREFTKSKPSI